MKVSMWRVSQRVVRAMCWSLGLALVGTAAPFALAAPTKPGAVFKDCHDCPPMVVIAPGTFQMGSPEAEKDRAKIEGPQHQVTIGHAFAIAKVPVTRDEYEKFVRETRRPNDKACEFRDATNSWLSDERRDWRRPGISQSGHDPVVCVSWDDAIDYITWLNRKVGGHHGTQGPYRLPTEAEWEYAARAGTTTPYWQGEELPKNGADCADCGSKWDKKSTAPVGSFSANPWGLSDVTGNAWEWIADCWHETYADAPADGTAWMNGNCAVRGARGGSFISNTPELRSAARNRWPQASANYIIGFRIARTLDEPAH